MTCEVFGRIVTDLACGFLIEAASRKRALAHAQACLRCAARLQQERALTDALNEVASAEPALAPAHTRAALLIAFQQQTATGVVALPLLTNRPLRRRSLGVMAAAAAVLLAAILVVLQLLHQQSKVESSAGAAPALAGASSLPGPSHSNDVNGQSSSKSNAVKGEAQKSSTLDKADQITPPRATRRRARAIFSPVLARTNKPAVSETVTDFIPLTAVADSTAMRSGTIVRVEMPRASLIAMGLPLHIERANETVKADIVVGDDGLARAIRLVY
jgi:negative regulator of sigma E activity